MCWTEGGGGLLDSAEDSDVDSPCAGTAVYDLVGDSAYLAEVVAE